jgi:hypothetical protein
MSYYLYDANGYVADGPSTQGLADLAAWARDKPGIRDFFRSGVTRDPAKFADDLAAAWSPTAAPVESSYRALVAAARRAVEVLILSDGVGSDLPQIKE